MFGLPFFKAMIRSLTLFPQARVKIGKMRRASLARRI
jgi:hypothetical protein